MYKEIGSHAFHLRKRTDFKEYLGKSGLSILEWDSLTTGNKEKVILRYKWCGANDASNQDCEITRRVILRDYEHADKKNMEEWERWYLENMLEDERRIQKIRSEAGMIMTETDQKRVNVVKEIFGGKQVSWEE